VKTAHARQARDPSQHDDFISEARPSGASPDRRVDALVVVVRDVFAEQPSQMVLVRSHSRLRAHFFNSLCYVPEGTRTGRRSQTSAPPSVLETCTDHIMFPRSGPTSVPQLQSRVPDRSHAERVQRSIPNRDACDQSSTSSRLRVRPSSARIDALTALIGESTGLVCRTALTRPLVSQA
jgi:hypothetical protein